MTPKQTEIVRGWDKLPRVGDKHGPLWIAKSSKVQG